jgi:hypothetical protein
LKKIEKSIKEQKNEILDLSKEYLEIKKQEDIAQQLKKEKDPALLINKVKAEFSRDPNLGEKLSKTLSNIGPMSVQEIIGNKKDIFNEETHLFGEKYIQYEE